MTKEKAFEMLKEFSEKLDQISYDDVYSLLIESIQRIPIPMAVLQKNTEVDRARLNIETELYNNINDLGYIKDDDIIEKYLKNYGRANKPHQVMFYAALRTSLIDQPRLTAIAETSKLFQDKNGHNLKGEKYTISRWLGNEKFYVAEIVFAKKAIENNPDIKKAFENQINFANQSEETDIEFYKEFLIFISEEFARKITKNDDYKISAAYTNLILQHPEIEGIVFPSVQTGYQGANIVMPPSTIDKYFKPKVCTTHILYKISENMLIANGEHYCNNISTEKLEWQLTDKQLLSSEDDIKKHFKL